MSNRLIFLSMGTIKKGILGGFSGKVGNVVGASWKGIDYIRTLPAKVRNPKSRKQLTQRSKFALMGKFVRTILPVIQVGFKGSAATDNSAYGEAMAYNVLHAVKGEYPAFEIDYPKVAIARGGLHGAKNLVAICEAGKLKIAWDTAPKKNVLESDRVLLLAYNPDRQEAEYEFDAAARGDGNASLDLPTEWDGEAVETFIVFISEEDESLVSDSVYAGRHVVVIA